MEDSLGNLNRALVNPSGKVLHRDKLWESYFYIYSKEIFINRWTVVPIPQWKSSFIPALDGPSFQGIVAFEIFRSS